MDPDRTGFAEEFATEVNLPDVGNEEEACVGNEEEACVGSDEETDFGSDDGLEELYEPEEEVGGNDSEDEYAVPMDGSTLGRRIERWVAQQTKGGDPDLGISVLRDLYRTRGDVGGTAAITRAKIQYRLGFLMDGNSLNEDRVLVQGKLSERPGDELLPAATCFQTARIIIILKLIARFQVFPPFSHPLSLWRHLTRDAGVIMT